MTQMTLNEETKAVKKALVAAGVNGVKVSKGGGSSYGWIYIHHTSRLDTEKRIRTIAQNATGRTNRDAESILIMLDDLN